MTPKKSYFIKLFFLGVFFMIYKSKGLMVSEAIVNNLKKDEKFTLRYSCKIYPFAKKDQSGYCLDFEDNLNNDEDYSGIIWIGFDDRASKVLVAYGNQENLLFANNFDDDVYENNYILFPINEIKQAVEELKNIIISNSNDSIENNYIHTRKMAYV